MATTKKPAKKRRTQKTEARAQRRSHPRAEAEPVVASPTASSGAVDRDVDESPEAVESRRESQSGPGATGVAHTGPAAADAHDDADNDDDDVKGATRPSELDPMGSHPHS